MRGCRGSECADCVGAAPKCIAKCSLFLQSMASFHVVVWQCCLSLAVGSDFCVSLYLKNQMQFANGFGYIFILSILQ